jgi:hypothetical protein
MANKLTVEVVAVCGLVALGVGLYYHVQLNRSREAVLALQQGAAQLDGKMQAVSAQRAKAEAQVAAAKAAAEQKAASGAPAAAGPRESPNDILMREMTENPEMRQALGKYFIAGYRLHYAQLARMAGFSEAQMSQLADANFKKWSDQLDLTQAIRLSGDSGNSDTNVAQRALQQKISDAFDEAVRGAVGQAGFQQVQDFDRTYSARTMANQVAAGAASGAAPLTADQTDQLARLIADGSPDYRQGNGVNVDKLDWDKVMAQATTLLSPEQMTALNSIHATQDLQAITGLYLIDRRSQP